MDVMTIPLFKIESRRLRFAVTTIASSQIFKLKGNILPRRTVSEYLFQLFEGRTVVWPQLIFEVIYPRTFLNSGSVRLSFIFWRPQSKKYFILSGGVNQ